MTADITSEEILFNCTATGDHSIIVKCESKVKGALKDVW
jgi:hypothetical protein